MLQRVLQELQLGDAPDVDRTIRLERVLLYSFDNLSTIQQQMFLDVATVLAGQPSELALAVWGAWQEKYMGLELQNLEQRSLLELRPASGGSRLGMHDVLKYLGRGIVLGRGRYPSSYRAFVGSRLFVSRWREYEYGGGALSMDDYQQASEVDKIFGYAKVRAAGGLPKEQHTL